MKDLEKNKRPEEKKMVLVRPIFKKKEKTRQEIIGQ